MSPIFKQFSFLLVLRCVLSQVCNDTRSIYREIPETYRFSYIETYEEPCIIFCSVKTRTSVNITTRIVQRFENVSLSVCCEGYVEDNNHEGKGLYCKPVCNPPCENGFCRKPNQCACEAGYALDPLLPHVCKPLCLEGCEIYDCIPTKTLQCFSNSSSGPISNGQSPFCAEPCINSVCVGSDICQCLPGYHQSSAHACQLTSYSATESCEHGTLVDPFTCLCDQGWQWKCGSCQPICNGCDQGTCVSPGQCECYQGYAIERGKCEPQCSKGCTNGRCVCPEHCSCNSGWYKTEKEDCKAHCDMNCEHGNCIAPNVCECHSGYQLYINKTNSRCLPNSKDCEDSTSEPETCICEAPYEIRYFAENGGECDCIGACYNSSRTCTKATCLYMDLGFDMRPPELYNSEEKYDANPVLEKPSDRENDEMSTPVYVEQNEKTVETNDAPPELNYDYNSDEEETEEEEEKGNEKNSTVKVTPDTKSIINATVKINKNTEIPKVSEMSHSSSEETDQFSPDKQRDNVTFSVIERHGNTGKVNTTEIPSELGYEKDETSDENSYLEESLDNEDEEFTIPNVARKGIPDSMNVATTALNSNNVKEKRNIDTLKLDVYWISGAVIIGAIIMLLVLGLLVKRKCFKKHYLNSTGKNDDVIVHYTNKIA